MSNVKERLLGAITVMNEEEAMRLWEFVLELSGNGCSKNWLTNRNWKK